MEDMSRSTVSQERWTGPAGQVEEQRPLRSGDTSVATCAKKDVERIAQLVRTIEYEVVPRMLIAHRSSEVGARLQARDRLPTANDVEELARLVLAHDTTVALSFVAALRAQGTPLESVYLDLMAPAARYLGELWCQDLCDFTEVTIGLMRLHQVLRHFSVTRSSEVASRGDVRRVLLMPAPHEQHSFGLFMVAEFFRRAGWGVWEESACSSVRLAELVSGEHFDLVGFSLSCDTHLGAVSANIRLVRRASCNRTIGQMVGGRVFAERPELVAKVGADATAVDGKRAVQQAQSLVTLLADRDS